MTEDAGSNWAIERKFIYRKFDEAKEHTEALEKKIDEVKSLALDLKQELATRPCQAHEKLLDGNGKRPLGERMNTVEDILKKMDEAADKRKTHLWKFVVGVGIVLVGSLLLNIATFIKLGLMVALPGAK